MATSLKIDTGTREYDLNGAVTVRFNPTDSEFVERLYSVFTDLEAKQGEFQAEVDAIGTDGERLFEYARRRDAEMRGIIDGLLGDGVSDAVFGNMNCYALADGLPVWINLMFAIAEEVEGAFTAEQGKADPRLAGYNKKYAALASKYQRKK